MGCCEGRSAITSTMPRSVPGGEDSQIKKDRVLLVTFRLYKSGFGTSHNVPHNEPKKS